jgi:hypothetical protein
MSIEVAEDKYDELNDELNRLCRQKIDAMYEGKSIGEITAIQNKIDECVQAMLSLEEQYGEREAV